LLTATLLSATHVARAITCGISAQGVAFGSYDPFSNQSLDGSGEINVICDASTAYSIALSTGRASYSPRAMADGTHELFYNLYIDATRTTIWGDATGGTAIVAATGIGERHTVYGRIPARQNAFVGSYADTVVVTLTF
jgi:spore coat protein U-like protein